MQLTRFDRWLREKFVYQTHILTLRPPATLPSRVRAVTLPDTPGKRYKHLFVTSSGTAAASLIRQLKEDGQMYATTIVDRDAWFVPLIAPKNRSLTWRLFSVVIIGAGVFALLVYVKGLIEDPTFRKNFMEALEIMKG